MFLVSQTQAVYVRAVSIWNTVGLRQFAQPKEAVFMSD